MEEARKGEREEGNVGGREGGKERGREEGKEEHEREELKKLFESLETIKIQRGEFV